MVDPINAKFSVYFRNEEATLIEGLAEKFSMTRSDFLRKVVLMGLEDVQALDSLGMMAVGRFMRDLFSSATQEQERG